MSTELARPNALPTAVSTRAPARSVGARFLSQTRKRGGGCQKRGILAFCRRIIELCKKLSTHTGQND
jgi:hypothetical protein